MLHLETSVHGMHNKASQWRCLRNIILYLFCEIILEIQNIIGQDRRGDAKIFTLYLREILCFTAELARSIINGVIVYIP
jgi:hypothetical protein